MVAFLSSSPWAAEPETPASEQARALVQAALASEAAGDPLGRQRRLREALAIDPDCPEANWHGGRIRFEDQWIGVEAAQAEAARNPHLKIFRTMRDKYAGTVPGELKLARWCRVRRPDVARMYYSRLLTRVELDERTRREAVERLDLTSYRGQLVARSEAARLQERVEQIEAAWAQWYPKLQMWRKHFRDRRPVRRARGIDEISQVEDPHIAVVAESFAAATDVGFASEIVKLLGRFPEYEATRAITAYAIGSPAVNVREAAIAELKRRPMHTYVPLVLSTLVAPIDSQWEVVRMSDGTIRYLHALYQEGTTEHRLVVSTHSSVPAWSIGPYFEPRRTSSTTWSKTSDWKVFQTDEARYREQGLREAAQNTDADVDRHNQIVAQRSAAAFRALEATTQMNLPRQASEWWTWWTEFNEVLYNKPTRTLYNRTEDAYSAVNAGPYYQAISCFPAGVQVVTEDGAQPIEQIQVGDRVLSQHPQTGELSFKVVLATTERVPSQVLSISIEGQPLLTTLGHPLWVANRGWRMAKRIQVGDQLHGLDGAVTVDGIEQPPGLHKAYNLVVDGHNTYFAGAARVLVHDNTFRKPTSARLPGLASPVK